LNPRAKRIGLLGGTFDPVHNGHLQIAGIAGELCHLREVWFVPASVPPHKNQQAVAGFSCRADMIRLAIADRPDFRLSTIEADLPEPSYTIDTLRFLHTHFVNSAAPLEFFFIIGADAFLDITSWKSYKDILQTVHLVVLGRSGCAVDAVKKLLQRLGYGPDDFSGAWRHPAQPKKIFFFCSPQISISDASSSEIRRKIKNNLSVEKLVPAAVLAYIKTKGLYA
jgi:nicotinate-nucleotide adenylyltransferase